MCVCVEEERNNRNLRKKTETLKYSYWFSQFKLSVVFKYSKISKMEKLQKCRFNYFSFIFFKKSN